jgi:Ca2+/Na+ antiporter
MKPYSDICLTIINQQNSQAMKSVNFFLTLSLLSNIALAFSAPTFWAKFVFAVLCIVHVWGLYKVNKKSSEKVW